MRRRELLALVATMATSPGLAQTRGRLPTIGFLGFATATVDRAGVEALREGLRTLGHVEGETILLVTGHAGGDLRRAAALIDEMARRPVDVFVAPGPAAARLILKVTTIPIVAIGLPPTASEPDLFASLAEPGGRLTGFSSLGEDLSDKRIEVLRELLPAARVIGVVHNVADPVFRDWGVQTAASVRAQGLTAIQLGLTSASPGEVAPLLQGLRDRGGDAVVIVRDFLTHTLVGEILDASTRLGMAAIVEQSDQARAGAVLSYGTHIPDLFRRAAAYADRIIKGESPGRLPIQLPTRLELVINVRAARQLGIDVPPALLARADEVIE